ncbi:MAG: aminoacyl-tRNA hydrolase [Candidatus Gracilibacteria bacterium]|nr:aminoacyl-tRNA hydrolase [Candidatus Peregrinibacteria bacterium]
MLIIVGLGNPGSQYQKTRHNVGFMALDMLAQKLNADDFKSEKKFNADISSADFHGEKLILVKPTTFMNLSGEAVQSISQFYKVEAEDIIIVYDDLDLSLGQIRIRKSGSPGTHNGMKSIVQYIGSDFPRIRIGIESRGETAPKQQETSSFVLSPFLQEEEDLLADALEKTVKSIESIVDDGIDSAMNSYNAK